MIKCDSELLVKSMIISSLANGISHIENVDISLSIFYTALEAIRRMGVKVQIDGDKITIFGNGKYLTPKHTEIDARGCDDILFLFAPIIANSTESVSIVNIGEKPYLKDYIASMQKYGMKISGDGNKIDISPSKLNLESVMLSIDSSYLYDSVLIGSLYADRKSIIYVRSNMYNTTLLLLEAMHYEYKKKNYIIVEKNAQLYPIDLFIGNSTTDAAKYITDAKVFSYQFQKIRADLVAMEAIRSLPSDTYHISVKYLSNGYFPIANIDIVRVKP